LSLIRETSLAVALGVEKGNVGRLQGAGEVVMMTGWGLEEALHVKREACS